ncbi:hypothetical protein [Dysosmobacter sp.]|uniref:hypothetical protein n=1 Tax=Dysosmobacter sp. TaxID=2591382 RepID=UPI002A9410C0|nr:hypothetical protein [Dysosmobacter sp.]MDY5613589.1 hypothetical protein [Dysosmobacter sp.]
MRRKGSLWQSVLRAVGDEGPLMTGVGRVMLLVVLNVCLLLGMIPVITGGAAWLALYTVLLEREERNYITACGRFFRVLRQKLARSILPWLLTLLGVGSLTAAWWIVLTRGWTNQFFLLLPLLLATAAIAFTVLWFYPLMAVSDMSWRQAVPAAFLLGLRELWRSLVLLILEVLLIALALYCAAGSLTLTSLWLLLGITPIELLKMQIMAGNLPKTA